MICTEVAEMYEFAKKVIAPVGAAVILAALFYPCLLYTSDAADE